MQNFIPVRSIDTDIYMESVKALLKEGKEVPLLLSGNSMSPFLVHLRDSILIGPVRQELKKGDMAFYQRESGQYVMHRICRVRREEGRKMYYFVGDAQDIIEGPIRREQIFGVITAAYRKGKWQKPGSFWWFFFRCVWIRVIPLRKTVCKLYASTGRLLFSRSLKRTEGRKRADGLIKKDSQKNP